MKRFVSASSRRIENSEDRRMITTEHGEVVDCGPGMRCTTFGIGKATIKALEGRSYAGSLVGPSVGQTAVSKIDKTTLLNMITESINMSYIRSTRT